MIDYPYGTPPAWWGKGKAAAGQAAREAIELSVPISDKLRIEAGNGDVLDLRNQLYRLFADEAERAEAVRLLDLAAWVRRNRRVAAWDGGLFAEVVSDGDSQVEAG